MIEIISPKVNYRICMIYSSSSGIPLCSLIDGPFVLNPDVKAVLIARDIVVCLSGWDLYELW